MANSSTEITLLDGDRNIVVLANGVLDTSNLAARTIIDVSALVPAATGVRIDKVTYSISSQLSMQIVWDATADVVALTLAGYGHFKFKHSAGLLQPTPPAAGSTGDIQILSTGWASGTQTYSLLIEAVKLGV